MPKKFYEIDPRLKSLQGTSTLAYYENTQITDKKVL
jgi:hypothetical protein